MELSPVEVRIIGSLIEKELTTPQYYPLTLNALTAACNQSSNRNPVMNLEDGEIRRTLDALKDKGLARLVHSPSNRALKFRQVIHEVFALERTELAVLGVLMLRGPQTIGELRARTERMCEFASMDDVEEVVTRLGEKVEPLAVRLTRQPGQKEGRVAHLLGDADPQEQPVAPSGAYANDAEAALPSRPDRVAALEEAVAGLTHDVARLRADLDALRGGFG